MNVFLSWSGTRSREVAEALYKWLPTVINIVEPFISQRSIEKGVVGQNELSKSLEDINFGIICLTKDNLHADWILYEAGALSKFQKESRVWTFLLDIKPENISEPLAKFQHTNFEKKEIFQLLQSINKAVSQDRPLKDELLEEVFNLNWERLNKILSDIKAKEAATPEPTRDPSDINIEVLEVVRRQENTIHKLLRQNEELNQNISNLLNRDSRFATITSPLQPIQVDSSGNVMHSVTLPYSSEQRYGIGAMYPPTSVTLEPGFSILSPTHPQTSIQGEIIFDGQKYVLKSNSEPSVFSKTVASKTLEDLKKKKDASESKNTK